jgi:hypothetical protein
MILIASTLGTQQICHQPESILLQRSLDMPDRGFQRRRSRLLDLQRIGNEGQTLSGIRVGQAQRRRVPEKDRFTGLDDGGTDIGL